MANTFNPKTQTHRVDTASTTVKIRNENVYVKSIMWSQPTTAGHKVIIKNANDDAVIWELSATAANVDEPGVPIEAWWQDGFRVTTLDSGIVIIDLG